MRINEEESALLSLENMELKLSMVLSLMMPTRRAGARTRARIPHELPATCSGPARERGLALLKANPREGAGEPGQEPGQSTLLCLKTRQHRTCQSQQSLWWGLSGLVPVESSGFPPEYDRAEPGGQPGLHKDLLMKMHNFICSAKTLKCPFHLLLSAP